MILEYLIPILIILILILLNGMFVAAEFALVTAPRTQLRTMEEKGSAVAARILKIVSDPDKQNLYITTAQVGITIASLGLGMYGEHVVAEWILEALHNVEALGEAFAHTVATILSVSLLTYLHVVLGEMIPKSFALQTASRVAVALYFPLNIANKLFLPIVGLLNRLSLFLIHRFGMVSEQDDNRLFTSGDIEFVVEESLGFGMLEYSDQLFIENILDLDDRSVRQVMTPRNLVNALADDLTPDEIVQTICGTTKTRYPIYHETLDKIRGILHIKDLARYYSQNQRLPEDITDLLRPALYVPESLELNRLLTQFRQHQTHIAVVLDEFGGTLGVITLEDLIEEVVGEILDEFDLETPPIQKLNGTLYRVRGDVILEELEQHLDLSFAKEIEATTIAGLVMTELGAIPQPEDTLTLPEMTITVEEVEQRAIKFVTIQLHEPTNP